MKVTTAPLFSGPESDPGILDRLHVTVGELAELLDVSPATVMSWQREEGMPRQAKGRYPVKACVQWHARRQKHKRSEDSSLSEERRQLIVVQREHQELENAKLRGELFDAEIVKTIFRQFLATVATQLDGIAPRVTPRLIHLGDPARMQRELYEECRAVRNAAAAALEGVLTAGMQPAAELDENEAAPARKTRRRAAPAPPEHDGHHG